MTEGWKITLRGVGPLYVQADENEPPRPVRETDPRRALDEIEAAAGRVLAKLELPATWSELKAPERRPGGGAGMVGAGITEPPEAVRAVEAILHANMARERLEAGDAEAAVHQGALAWLRFYGDDIAEHRRLTEARRRGQAETRARNAADHEQIIDKARELLSDGTDPRDLAGKLVQFCQPHSLKPQSRSGIVALLKRKKIAVR